MIGRDYPVWDGPLWTNTHRATTGLLWREMERTMKLAANALVLLSGLALVGCGAPQERAADPSTASEGDLDGDDEYSGDDGDEAVPDDEGYEASSSAGETRDDSSQSVAAPDTEQQDEDGAGQCRPSDATLTLEIDRESVEIERGRLRAKMDGAICNIKMNIMLKDGLPTVEKAFRYSGAERELRWNPIPRDQIEKIVVRIDGDDGGYQSVRIVPWSVRIDHKEVEFDTNRGDIRASEVPSLDESYEKIKEVLGNVEGKELGTITLFIAGHTDTVGSNEHNLTLSRNRARAIAAWFMKRGLCIPVAFEGFGESALKKLTADDVDAQENRRVDYILSVEPPSMGKKGSSPAWKWISKGC